MKKLVLLLAFTVMGCGDGGVDPTGRFGRTIFGLTLDNTLIAFGSERPDLLSVRVRITGIRAGETIVGIDFGPQDGRLYALGSSHRVFVLNPLTGAATPVDTAFTPRLRGSAFGVSFDPAANFLRVHSDSGQNLRLNPIRGTVAATDTTLAYAAGDVNADSVPRITGTAYSSSVAGGSTTELYAIDHARDVLVRLPNPNSGRLTTVGPLGVNTVENVGFDIVSEPDRIAYATLSLPDSPTTKLYTIDLRTGAATLVGNVGGEIMVGAIQLISIAAAPQR